MSFKYLIEELENFDIIDYQDDKNDIIGAHTVTNLTFKYHPKDADELDEICQKRYNKNPRKPFLGDIDTTLVTDMSNIFDNYDSSILDLSYWNTSNVTNMSSMFLNCEHLEKVILSDIDTSNVKDMECMFYGCKSLKDLDLSNFNTENVTDMSGMFSGCKSLNKLDLSNFNTINLDNVDSMFSDCRLINYLDLSSFGYIETADDIFYNTSIKKLKISKLFFNRLFGTCPESFEII